MTGGWTKPSERGTGIGRFRAAQALRGRCQRYWSLRYGAGAGHEVADEAKGM